jgi:hypothetical protein
MELAQAKNAMGPTAISPLKYDARMTALATAYVVRLLVALATLVGWGSCTGARHRTGTEAEPPMWTLVRAPPADTSAAPAPTPATPTTTARPSPAETESSSSSSSSTAASVAPAAGAPGAGTDPLRWFGVLVSPHLRKAQDRFVQALPLLVALATDQAALDDVRSRYLAALAALPTDTPAPP